MPIMGVVKAVKKSVMASNGDAWACYLPTKAYRAIEKSREYIEIASRYNVDASIMRNCVKQKHWNNFMLKRVFQSAYYA